MIDVPQDVMSYRTYIAFVPLNSTEIAILGGKNENDRLLGEVYTFSTTTNRFKREAKGGKDTFSTDFDDQL